MFEIDPKKITPQSLSALAKALIELEELPILPPKVPESQECLPDAGEPPCTTR